MLATVGLVVPEFVRIPGAQFSFEAVPNVLDAHDALLDTSMKQILIWVSLAEVCTLGALSNMNEFDRAPGDFGFDPMGFYPTDPAKQREMKLKELKNGRLVSLLCSCSLFLTVSNRAFPIHILHISSYYSLETKGNGCSWRYDPRSHRIWTRIPIPINITPLNIFIRSVDTSKTYREAPRAKVLFVRHDAP